MRTVTVRIREPIRLLAVLPLLWTFFFAPPSATASRSEVHFLPPTEQREIALGVRFDQYNERGDVVSQTDGAGATQWEAAYEAYGKRVREAGATKDRQKANTKDEDPTGLLNEGMRYRDLETGVWLSRDPAGFVDGPNLYAYVTQNPWSKFDPDGLQGFNPNRAPQQAARPEPPSQIVRYWNSVGNNVGRPVTYRFVNTPEEAEVHRSQTQENRRSSGPIVVPYGPGTASSTPTNRAGEPIPGAWATLRPGSPESTQRQLRVWAEEEARESQAERMKSNAENGARRELETHEQLQRENPGQVVQRERYLRDANGNIVRDPVTGEARRVDHAIIDRENNRARTFETTGPQTPKDEQTAKEGRIRNEGGGFIRDRETRKLVPTDGVSDVIRRP